MKTYTSEACEWRRPQTRGEPSGWLCSVVAAVWVSAMCCCGSAAAELTVISPTNGMLVRGCEIVCTGTCENAEMLVWTNTWAGGGAGGELAAGPAWWFHVPCGFGTNTLTVIALADSGGAATARVVFIVDQSMIVITSQVTDFATNTVTFTIFGTGAYLKNIMWWNYYSSSNATGMIEGTNEWSIDVVGAAQGSNHFTVWGFSWLGVLSSDHRWYWVDSVAPAVTQLAPADGTNVPPPHVTLQWLVSEPAVCTVYTNNAVAGSGADELTLSNLNAGVYYWYVKAEDSVGNVGHSPTNYFIVPETGWMWGAMLFTICEMRFRRSVRWKRTVDVRNETVLCGAELTFKGEYDIL